MKYRFIMKISIQSIEKLLRNEDSYCLFRSTEILRRKHTMTANQYRYYKDNDAAQTRDVDELINTMGIPKDLDEYDIETYGPRIQSYYNMLHPGMFKVN